MKRQLYTLALGFFLVSSGLAFSAERSVIIGFKQKPGPSERTLVHGAKGTVQRTYQLIPAMAAILPEEEIENLRKNPKIDYIEENAFFWSVAEPRPNEESGNSWGVSRISAGVAHASGNKGTGVRIAVLDTGIDYTHEDLAGNYRGGYDFVFDDADPFDDNPYSHGTHVAGIIAAEQNGIGVVGVAPEAHLLAVKVLDGGGFGRVDWVIAGIQWAVDNGADIINMSIEGHDSQALRAACDGAYDAGVRLVAAGGNNPAGDGPVMYPAAYDSVIAVTATDASDVPAYFSPIGEDLELAAPGVDILSTVANGGYDRLSGTSQAAPHVSGTAALCIRSNTKDLNGDGTVNHEDLRLMLQRSAMDLGAGGKDEIYGHGLVNAAAASLADRWNVTTTTAPPEAFAITIDDLTSVLVVTKDDGVHAPSLALGIEFTGVIFWMDIWTGGSADAFWGTGDVYFGNISRSAGTMSGVVFKDTGSVATFTATK